MLEHIVKNNEKVEDILNLYRISIDELMSYNLHLTDFNNLICGTKIKIPLITEEIEQVLTNTESFVNDYYPMVDEFEPEVKKVEVSNNETLNKKDYSNTKNTINRGRPYPGIVPPKFQKF